jgi:biotin-(acetyl-CoA carboxylase) ligase
MPLSLHAGEKVPFVQYIGCLAVVAALQQLFRNALGASFSSDSFPIRIKWPNDIYAVQTVKDSTGLGDLRESAVKIGGILCQSVTCATTHNLVVGIGLNITNGEPTVAVDTILRDRLLRGEAHDMHAVTRGTVLAEVLNNFETLLEV